MSEVAAAEFHAACRERQRGRVVEAAERLAIAAAVIALFAWITSLDILRNTALIALCLPFLPLAAGLVWVGARPGLRRALARGAAAMVAAGVATGFAWTHQGLGLGYERKLGELPPMRVRQADIEARRHPSQEVILEAIERARDNPTSTTLRPLIPFLHDNHLLLTTPDDRTRPAASVVREVLLANPWLFHRGLHAEALSMASLLPLEGPVPPVVEVDVAARLRESLGLLIELHSERRMQGRFDVPTVGLMLPTVVDDPERGPRIVRHEVGLTYPFGGIPAGSDVELDFETASALLDALREGLGY